MAYSRTVREAARRYWLLGQSDEKIIPLLKADFPNEPTPNRPKTILEWRHAENWEADLEIIAVKADQKRTDLLATELASMNARQLALLGLLDSHVQLILTARMIKCADGKQRDTELSASELSQIASTLDRSIKNQRLIRGVPTEQSRIDSAVNIIEWEKLTDEQLERILKGESPARVLAQPSVS